jgi:predicted  nucleic acid-binding Zn-ribbon protein
MSVRQLYELQVLELDIASAEQSAAQAQARLNDSEELRLAQLKLNTARGGLEALAQQQKQNDWAVAYITARMTVTSESLYGGRVRNPKELTDLQHELDALTRQRNPLEEKALGYMEKIQSAQEGLAKLDAELKATESRLREERKALHAQLEEIKVRLAALHEQHAARITLIPPEEVRFYADLKKRRGAPVVRVEKGTCACRISLSSAELQRARAGKIVQCSSCSRILFIE